MNRTLRKAMRTPAGIGFALVLGLTGCQEPNDLPSRTMPTVQSDVEPEAAPSFETVEITTSRVLNDIDPSKLRNGDTMDDNPISRWAEKRFGVVQRNKWIVADEAALEQRIRLALAGEEELPDVLYLNDSILPILLKDVAASGRFLDVGEAFEKYASPRLKEAYRNDPDVWRTVKLDGKLWGLPTLTDGKMGDPILWIRKDWLDTLGLPEPKTLRQFEEVLDGFANSDPDRNGKKDTVGLALAGQNSLNDWMGDASFLFGANGDQPYQWNRMEDGSIAYGSIQPEIERSLTVLSEWYKAGYLSPDFGTHDVHEAVELFMSGKAGMISGPGWMGGWPLSEPSELPEGEAKPQFKPIPFPAGEDGTIGRRGSKISYGSYVFRAGFEHMDRIFEYLDAVYGSLIEDPKSDFAIGYAEGYDYLIEDEEVTYNLPDYTSTISQHFLVAPGIPPGVKEDSLEARVYRGQVETSYEKRLAATSSRLFLEGKIVEDIQLRYAQKDAFMGPRSAAMQAKWPALQQLEREAFLKIVYGQASPDTFRDFVRDWRAYGGDDLTREVNEWDRMNR